MRYLLRKPFSWIAIACLAFASPILAQQDTTAVNSLAAADTVTTSDSPVVAADTSLGILASDSAGIPAADSTANADSLAAPAPSVSDSSQTPTRAAARTSARSNEPARKPASSPGALPMEVIDWDWDDFTHVTEVGMRHLDTGREFELVKDSVYTQVWERQKGKRLWVWGTQRSLGDGFWALELEKFEPLLTMAAADSVARADSIAKADSIARADSLARADSVVRADSIATADSIAAANGLPPAATPAAPADSAAAAAQAPGAAGQNAQPAQTASPGAAQIQPADSSSAAPPDSGGPPDAAADSTKNPRPGAGDRPGGPQP